MKSFRHLITSLIFLHSSITFGAVVHHIQYDQLVGATGIEVGNEFYQVQFIDSSCILLFDNCDETSDFFFTDVQSAHAANLALLEQVLLDLPSGQFDSQPELTNGCYSLSRCSIVTPVGTVAPQLEVFPAVFLTNKADLLQDIHTGAGSTFRASDFSLRNSSADTLTYALWRKDTGSGVSVPIPASIFLLCSALFAVLVIKDRKPF